MFQTREASKCSVNVTYRHVVTTASVRRFYGDNFLAPSRVVVLVGHAGVRMSCCSGIEGVDFEKSAPASLPQNLHRDGATCLADAGVDVDDPYGTDFHQCYTATEPGARCIA